MTTNKKQKELLEIKNVIAVIKNSEEGRAAQVEKNLLRSKTKGQRDQK